MSERKLHAYGSSFRGHMEAVRGQGGAQRLTSVRVGVGVAPIREATNICAR